MFANSSLISSNFSSLLFLRNHKVATRISFPNIAKIKNPKNQFFNNSISGFGEKGRLCVCHSSLNLQDQEDPSMEKDVDGSTEEDELGGGSNNGDQWDWTTSFVLFGLWSGLMYYVFFLAPNQTPLTDMYFLKKLLNLKGDDGFQMNEVLVGLWYIMGLWPLVYSMLLLPTARSSKGSIPIWPFIVLSCFGGAYVLIPYFALWKPPPPPVEETELQRLPLNLLESKLTAGIHVMSIDFSLLSAFAPFWIYNDMTARKWYDKGSWLLPLSVIPFLGPALYLLLRPSIPTVPALSSPTSTEEK